MFLFPIPTLNSTTNLSEPLAWINLTSWTFKRLNNKPVNLSLSFTEVALYTLRCLASLCFNLFKVFEGLPPRPLNSPLKYLRLKLSYCLEYFFVILLLSQSLPLAYLSNKYSFTALKILNSIRFFLSAVSLPLKPRPTYCLISCAVILANGIY